MQSFYAPGKILLVGEYTVTKGFEGLAVPVKSGQWMDVWEFDSPGNAEDRFIFNALDSRGASWFSESFDISNLKSNSLETNAVKSNVADENFENNESHLSKLLALVPESFWKSGKSYRFETRLEFERSSGLGSSSTFVQLMSNYFKLDPFQVQDLVFGGSGYDVAIAAVQKPLIYWRNEQGVHFRQWKLNSELTKDWKVVFLGNKVNSRTSTSQVSDMLEDLSNDENYRMQIQKIIEIVRDAQELMALETGIEMYQMFLSQLLGMVTPYTYFGVKPLPRGVCKWLGAWGGDMLLVNSVVWDAYYSLWNGCEVKNWNDLVINE
jgi:mevalonate kinase